MIVNKNRNQSQLLKTGCLYYEWWVNWFEEIQRYKTLLTVRLNKKTRNKWRNTCNENL